MALTISSVISGYYFLLKKDWKLVANGKKISVIPCQIQTEDYLVLKVVYNFQMDFPENYSSI